jgi:hypothetical protein
MMERRSASFSAAAERRRHLYSSTWHTAFSRHGSLRCVRSKILDLAQYMPFVHVNRLVEVLRGRLYFTQH